MFLGTLQRMKTGQDLERSKSLTFFFPFTLLDGYDW